MVRTVDTMKIRWTSISPSTPEVTRPTLLGELDDTKSMQLDRVWISDN
jgi:hypothetical protein